MRTMDFSSSNRKCAKLLASSVLPTPVGPRNIKDPVGLEGSEIPALDLRTASLTALTARFCPINRFPSSLSKCKSFWLSPARSRPVGIPVQAETTAAISSSDTISPTIRSRFSPSWLSASFSCFSSCGISPYRSLEASSRFASRCALSASTLAASSLVFSSPILLSSLLSASQRALSSLSLDCLSVRSS